jgi:hypothetical protein
VPPKKSRTPPPPRRSQGPRRRTDSRPADGDRRNRLILYGLAASGIVGLLVVLGLFAFTGGDASAKAAQTAMQDAGCTFKTYPEQPRTPHFLTTPPKTPFKYNSFPPSSGRHYYTPAVYGFYTEPLDKYSVVHNLEHGGIVVNWGNTVPQSQVAKIHDWWQNESRGLVAAPLPALGNTIAVVAWTHVAKCKAFDEAAF